MLRLIRSGMNETRWCLPGILFPGSLIAQMGDGARLADRLTSLRRHSMIVHSRFLDKVSREGQCSQSGSREISLLPGSDPSFCNPHPPRV